MTSDVLTAEQRRFIETFILSVKDPGSGGEDDVETQELDVSLFGDLFSGKKSISTLEGASAPSVKELVATAGKTGSQEQVNDLIGKSAAAQGEAKEAAKAAFLAFDLVTGGGEITSKRLTGADSDYQKALKAVEKARASLIKAKNKKATAKATEELEKAEKDAAEKKKTVDALVGTVMLKKALTDGPLSGKAGPKLPDKAVAALIEGFQVNPKLTWQTIDIAATAIDPTAVANAIPLVSKQIENNFADKDGAPPPDGLDVSAYAMQVLAMGGTCGPDYFARLDDYVASGGLRATGALPDGSEDSPSARGQKRSVAVAGALLDNGRFNADTDKSKLAIGHMLFHPDAMAAPTPALNAHVLETLHVFTDGDDATDANDVLEGVDAPSTDAGKLLVGRSVGTEGTPTKTETQTAILASMLQSVDQGPVGSCFATAPLRNMRESDPLTTLKKFREITEDGTFTSGDGTKTQVVTNLPPGEDPLIRCLEYSIATAMGRNDAMSLKKDIGNKAQTATYHLQEELKKTLDPTHVGNSSVRALTAIKTGFTTTYDPMVENPSTASDGHSSRGRYVLVATDGTVIESREKYRDKVLEMTLTAFGDPSEESERQAIEKVVDDHYMKSMDDLLNTDPPGNPPWLLKSGGSFVESLTTIHGNTNPVTALAKSSELSDTPEKIGARTTAVLGGLIDNLGDAPPDMLLVQTPGVHGFNLLPNHPTMKALMDGDGTTADKIRTKLTEPGARIATTALDLDETLRQYDRCIAKIAEVYQGLVDDPKREEDSVKRYRKRLSQFQKAARKMRPEAGMRPKMIAELCEGIGTDGLNVDYVKGALQGTLASGLSDPQVVLADTNWGSGEDHTFFVVAPDPISGKPMLWQRTDPPGSMRLAPSKDWIDREWQIMK
ncbi:hypothetical protein QO034_20070 [Sedimentitalea sp. JM2-8]|uniref:Uncharacterized protein n=1 Tax=Sedimentitalea xiamensis TaxID=3050037 RepID=A0ABT7FK87_9RHOB|nr:hypothetical protein [Sedimentitalea xiamensis]MDK3075380.1 hypothetical protein [Sedimentitalea xiamensis]